MEFKSHVPQISKNWEFKRNSSLAEQTQPDQRFPSKKAQSRLIKIRTRNMYAPFGCWENAGNQGN